MRTKLSRAEGSDGASPTAAAGGQGLMTACWGWGSCTQCYSPRNQETKKEC